MKSSKLEATEIARFTGYKTGCVAYVKNNKGGKALLEVLKNTAKLQGLKFRIRGRNSNRVQFAQQLVDEKRYGNLSYAKQILKQDCPNRFAEYFAVYFLNSL